MTPAARIAAAIGVLDRVIAGQPAEQALLQWSRSSRFAGSGDRAAVRDHVFEALRRRNSLARLGGGGDGRALMIGLMREADCDPADLFTGDGHAPPPLSAAERDWQATGDPETDLPAWLLPSWRESLGEDADAIAAAMGHRAPVWLRVNPLRGDTPQAVAMLAQEGIETRPAPQLATALRVTAGERRIQQAAAYRAGLVEVQDLSPQLACADLPLASGDRVLDFCAGGGGKTLALAGIVPDLQLVAHDADPARMRDLPARALRAGVQVQVSRQPQGPFRLVLADVPCSGSGTWRRQPDARWRLTPGLLEGLLGAQAQILDRCAGLVAPGGHLAYMTCSLLRDENDHQIAAFLARNPLFSEVSRTLWTPLQAGDGFFRAILRRAS
ncbi:RsmB/NOP family class I SAM-dependent RNA methyltransferase [Paracoccus spongiarum]|uniref:RsmB/NOP family class I SAM-dependent RNA methyltransferase n=1 Tax=Paracoccus spongiarum TaxID=3064387 RepID=A0ABT9JD87_9RHOB|nr:RsmB/NOP family class I SAM-dependent RNA methyltransferase [Paracoccus sp. 2205BS29-5]MDP5307739.1 RsmB/NOP family class I SAM-dependent RNA methyltransferase [Paracoccus sp. 2205BS29-5]